MIPLVSSDPTTFAILSIGESAFGVVAIGQEATGVIAIGQFASGFITIGQVARGFVAVGQLAVGVFALGQLALGLGPSLGMLAVSAQRAIGMLAVGGRAKGMLALSVWPRLKRDAGPPVHAVADLLSDPEPKWILARVEPFPSGPLLHVGDPSVGVRWASADVAQKAMAAQDKGRVLVRAERDQAAEHGYRQSGPGRAFVASDAFAPTQPRALYYGESTVPASVGGVAIRSLIFLLCLGAWLSAMSWELLPHLLAQLGG